MHVARTTECHQAHQVNAHHLIAMQTYHQVENACFVTSVECIIQQLVLAIFAAIPMIKVQIQQPVPPLAMLTLLVIREILVTRETQVKTTRLIIQVQVQLPYYLML